jgi:N-acetylmuramoyl-L-alanine amidase
MVDWQTAIAGGLLLTTTGMGALFMPTIAMAQTPEQASPAPAFDPAAPSTDLQVVYPPADHTTGADRIFFIGTGDPNAAVLINGTAMVEDRSPWTIAPRSPDGHFAPTLPLVMGENVFTLTQGETSLTLRITRVPTAPQPPEGLAFGADSLTPAVDIARPVGERICLSAIAPAGAQVTATVGADTIPLLPQSPQAALPPNYAVLTAQNAPTPLIATPYTGCWVPSIEGGLGQPTYTLRQGGQTVTATAPGAIEILPAVSTTVATVTVESGIARTGPSTSYSRITPLPAGTRAAVTAREGDWLRLDYGGWIRARETTLATAAPPQSTIRSVRSRVVEGWTEVLFPLETPVPITVDQRSGQFTLTLHNTTPQTDTIYVPPDAAIAGLDWTPVLPDQAQYRFQLQSNQAWGYKLRYDGTTLVLSLRHPPTIQPERPLAGITILLDPGHGSENDLGARGPNGYPEKDVNLVVSKLLREALEARGATVILTREGDDDLFPGDRVDIINAVEPTLALSIHYNALPDAGDALNTAGIGTFWYHAQAYDLAVFLHDYLVRELDRPAYGVFWNNLALTRPTVAPAVLLELGFMINPFEFEWIVDPAAQQALTETLADGIEAWVLQAQ